MAERPRSTDHRALLEEAYVAVDRLKARLERAERARREPIALIGMACRFPGRCGDPETFWEFLRRGGDGIGEVPADRWNADEFYDPDPETPGKICTRRGGFIEDVDRFDPAFFDIARREAISMDPQQRLLLEVSWEALENAGRPPRSLNRSATGVFVGLSTNDYSRLQMRSSNPAAFDVYLAAGSSHSIAAGRLSYVLGLQGPSVALDTACSSSLVALHLACRSLREGECRMALAGGVNLILLPDVSIVISRARMLAPDGRCKAFDAAADGFVRAEGCGVVVLKRLRDALADGDPIRAVIRGSAVNQDGRSIGLTAPNGPAQEAVLQTALADAGVAPSEVGYVEAHGTGTSLGDPIEVRALARVLGRGRDASRRLRIGSVKTNVGHLEAAAGMAGLFKLVGALRHGEIPPHLHLREPNPLIPWAELPVEVPTEPVPWSADGGKRIGGLSSFGFSGTNAHLIVEEPPPRAAEPSPPGPRAALYCVSARTPAALRDAAERHGVALGSGVAAADAAHTLLAGRSHFEQRLAVVAETAREAGERLRKYARAGAAAGAIVGEQAPGAESPQPAFVFSGGWRTLGAARAELFESQPVFRAELDRCAGSVGEIGGRSLIDWLYDGRVEDESIDPEWRVPALVAIQCALAETWRCWGVEPSLVVGVGAGECAAAAVSGRVATEQALQLALVLGRALSTARRPWGALWIGATLERVVTRIDPADGGFHPALDAGDSGSIFCGTPEALARLADAATAANWTARPIAMEPSWPVGAVTPEATAELDRAWSEVPAAPARVGWIASATGDEVAPGRIDGAAFGTRSLSGPLRWAEAVDAGWDRGQRVWLELGPPSGLLGPVRAAIDGNGEGIWLAGTYSDGGSRADLVETAARLYAGGVDLDGSRFDEESGGRKIALPTYPFRKERCWLTATTAATPALASKGEEPERAFLGHRSPLGLDAAVFERMLDDAAFDFLADHRIYGEVLVPGAAWIGSALAAGRRLRGDVTIELEQISFPTPLVLERGARQRIQTILDTPRADPSGFRVVSCSAEPEDGGGRWTEHATGRLRAAPPGALSRRTDGWQRQLQTGGDPRPDLGREVHRRARELSLELGPSFLWIAEAWSTREEALARMHRPSTVDDVDRYALHPGLIDSCFQLLGSLLPVELVGDSVYVPLAVGSLRWRPSSAELGWCTARLEAVDGEPAADTFHGTVVLVDEAGDEILTLDEVVLKRAPRDALLAAVRRSDRLGPFAVQWEDSAAREGDGAVPAAADWGISGDDPAAVAALVVEIGRRGGRAVAAPPSPVAPGDPAALLAHWREELGAVPDRVVELRLAADERHDPGASAFSLARWVQTLARPGTESGPRVSVVTGGAVDAGPGSRVDRPLGAELWGFGRVAAAEHPEVWAGLIDLDPDMAIERSVERLAEQLLDGTNESEVRLTGKRRLVPRLRRVDAASAAPAPALRGDATYVVSGGLGGLGLAVAERLAERGARQLLLLGRGAPSDAARPRIDALRSAGIRVETQQVDVADPVALERVRSQVDGRLPPPAGVVHAAGVLDDATIVRLDRGAVDRVFRPKVFGARNLYRLFDGPRLDFFVLFSSLASWVGSPGQSAYAAANAALDALAASWRAAGARATSIAWGPWAEVGMAARLDVADRERMERAGLKPIDPARALDRFDRVVADLLGPEPELPPAIVLVDAVWSRVGRSLPALGRSGLLADWVREAEEAPTDAGQAAAERARIEALAPAERAAALTAALRERLAQTLAVPLDAIDPRRPMNGLGIDSLMAVEIRNRAERELGLALPLVHFLDGSSLEQMVIAAAGGNAGGSKLDPRIAAAAAARSSEGERAERLLEEIDEMSEERMDQLLGELLPRDEEER